MLKRRIPCDGNSSYLVVKIN